MLVSSVLGDCPSCGAKDSFGNVSVGKNLLQGCTNCKYESAVWLPPVKKKVIYLDQFVFSGAMRGNDSRFSELAKRVENACELQLLVAPFSSLHEDESYQWQGYDGMTSDQLMNYIKKTSRGAKFKRAYNVEHTQIHKAWQVFLKGGSSKYSLESSDAIEGENLQEWDDYFQIDVSGYWSNVDLIRKLKNQSVDELVKIFDQWQSSSATFEEAVALEFRDGGNMYISSYLQMIKRYADGDYSAVIDSPMIATVVQQMLHWLPDTQTLDQQLKKCIEFFRSPYFFEVPYHTLSAHIFATMKEMVKHGTFANREDARKRLNGIFEDIKHISLYAPYCDAIVVDKFMADLVRRPSVDIEQRYGVKVFSLSSWDALYAWLDSLIASISEEHKQAVMAAYPNLYHEIPAFHTGISW